VSHPVHPTDLPVSECHYPPFPPKRSLFDWFALKTGRLLTDLPVSERHSPPFPPNRSSYFSATARQMTDDMAEAGTRSKLDDRDNYTPVGTVSAQSACLLVVY